MNTKHQRDEKRRADLRELTELTEEVGGYDLEPAPWWYLSFCDGDRPKGMQFLGAAVVRGHDVASAVSEAHRLKCNPGGEAMGFEVRDGFNPPDRFRNRLLTRDDIDKMDALAGEVAKCRDCGREIKSSDVPLGSDGITASGHSIEEAFAYCAEHIPAIERVGI